MKCPIRGMMPCDDRCTWLVQHETRRHETGEEVRISSCAIAAQAAMATHGKLPNVRCEGAEK